MFAFSSKKQRKPFFSAASWVLSVYIRKIAVEMFDFLNSVG